MTDLIPRATIETIVRRRNEALDKYAAAYGALDLASAALTEAAKAAALSRRGVNRYTSPTEDERNHFISSLKVPQRERFMERAKHLTDVETWAHVIELTDLERLMDKKAKDEFTRQLTESPPEPTVDNIRATLQQFAADAGTIFRRGIANAFSNLDRRFKSHDGWKIGSRVILTRAFDEHGHWSYYSNERDTLLDIERTFLVLDGKPVNAAYASLAGEIDAARRGTWGARQTEVESTYFRVRIFKNGNAHLWFKRDDLVQKVNMLLGEYYGAPIPEDRAPDEDTGLNRPKTSLAKNYGFYPTPTAAAKELIDGAKLSRPGRWQWQEGKGNVFIEDNSSALTVLEPSAGSGNLARLCVDAGAVVDCIEVNADRADELRSNPRYRRVTQADFLRIEPNPAALYDRVVMNPPFDLERDIDHVMHALKFLKPDGYLTAIMSAGTEFRETRKATAFRALMQKMNAHWRDLPPGSFASVGTYCNTIILRVCKDGRRFY